MPAPYYDLRVLLRGHYFCRKVAAVLFSFKGSPLLLKRSTCVGHNESDHTIDVDVKVNQARISVGVFYICLKQPSQVKQWEYIKQLKYPIAQQYLYVTYPLFRHVTN